MHSNGCRVGWDTARALTACALTISALLSPLHAAAAAKKYNPPPVQPPPQEQAAADPLLPTSWHLQASGTLDAWKTTQGKPQVTIAVVDSGIDYNNPELAANIRRKHAEVINGFDDDGNGYVDDQIGWNFNEDLNLPYDDNGHGTFVAGIIAGRYGNGIGGAGVCPLCTILPLRFLDKDGLGDTADAVKAINYAVKEKVSVINLSFCGEGYDRDLSKALQAAEQNDIVVVVAAGNDGENLNKKDIYPQKFRLENMLSVAAVTRTSDLWTGSNYGDVMIDLGAPGTTIWGPWIDGKWYRSEGTSFAAPIVSGAVGLLRSANPSLKAPEIVRIIENTVRQKNVLQTKVRTGGTLDVAAAMACATNPKHPCLQ